MISTITAERACKPERTVRKRGHVIFDAADIDYLACNLDLSHLRHEHRRAEVELAVCRQYEETGSPDEVYWADYSAALRLTISIAETSARATSRLAGASNLKMPQGGGSAKPRRAAAVRERPHRAADVKSRTDIAEIIGQHLKLKPSGRILMGLCPFHNETNPSFTVYPDRQRWHCYGCGRGGDVFTFIQLAHNVDFKGAIRYLGGGR